VARDVTYPRARERAARLRERLGGTRREDGATLLAEGASVRGRYRILREMGRGGAGTVFLAHDGELARQVALKVYHRRGRADRERLLHEARTAAAFEHPGVIRVFDVDETLAAIAMEIVEGGSVRTELGKGGLGLPRALRWVESAVEVLRFIHRRGVVHRDVKPSNLLLRSNDRVVLTDFGVACPVGERAPSHGAPGEGSLAYMPPEQRQGAPAQPSMDVYALGVTVREILHRVACEVPAPLVEIAAACVRSVPSARPTLDEVAHALARARAESGPATRAERLHP
jgi:serine/threonine-protein kinase